MESYILRVYRYEPKAKDKVVGTLQELNRSSKIAFTSKDELWDVLQERLEHTKQQHASVS